MAASAPRYKVEGRIKGKYGPRKPRKRVKKGPTVSEETRFAGLAPDEIDRIKLVQRVLVILLNNRENALAAGKVLETIQLLAPLTALPGGAVTRDDLNTESMLPPGQMAVLSAGWGGRQDIDLVALYTLHRATFEQLAHILAGWQRSRFEEVQASKEEEIEERIRQLERKILQDQERHAARECRASSSCDEEPSSSGRGR